MTSSASDHITTPGKSPAFQFYANDFTTGTADLSAEHVGIYIRLLCHQWDSGRLACDMESMARIGRVSVGAMRRAWFFLQGKFVADPVNGPDFVVNERLEAVRAAQLAFRRRQSDNGKLGGRPRKPARNPNETQPLSQNKATQNPNKSSSVFCLQKRESVSLPTDEQLGERAREFIEFYAGLYPKRRNGVPYRRQDVLEFPVACSLCATWPDDRLRLMAEIFLRTDHPFAAEGRRSIKQFAALAELCDEKLRANGR